MGVLRYGEAILDLEFKKGSSLLTVQVGKHERDYLEALAQKPLTLPEKWTDCYKNDDQTHAFGMGVVIGSKLFSVFSNKDEAIDYVVQIFASANLIYHPQLNLVLVARKLHLQESHDKAPSWDQGPSCPMSIAEQLHAFDDWDPPGSDQLSTEGQGVWTLFDDCYVSGTIGLAYVGTVCQMEKNYWQQRPNTAVVFHSFRTWITFAHETGHNFGGEHSFELGEGKTGGIMDYGDGQLHGKFQFNTQFRKPQMCNTINQAVTSCSAVWLFDGQCGNGILTDDEQCECGDGSTSCTFCHNCMLETNKSCTPAGYGVHPIGLGVGTADCCTSKGTFQRSGAVCHVPGVGHGYCTAGLCIPSKCSDYHFVGDYCGLQNQNECKFMCLDKNKGCSDMEGWLVNQEPANYVRDQVPCNWKKAGDGVCMKGSCVPALEGCGNGLREEDEDCECHDGSLHCRFCSNCKLEKGKECTPDDEDGMCCDANGHFKMGTCEKGSIKGYCMQGLCQDTPCSTYKSWSGWGDFCGFHDDSTCKFKCEVDGKCDSLDQWLLGGQPLNRFPDGTHCDRKGKEGICKEGVCIANEAPRTDKGKSKKAEDLDLQPGHESSSLKNSTEGEDHATKASGSSQGNETKGTCVNCLNGATCDIMRERSKNTLSCEDLERDYGCDCSSCTSCSTKKPPGESNDLSGCPRTCGGMLWWAKSCDNYLWNSRLNEGFFTTSCSFISDLALISKASPGGPAQVCRTNGTAIARAAFCVRWTLMQRSPLLEWYFAAGVWMSIHVLGWLAFVRSTAFETTVAAVILMNCLTIGIEVDATVENVSEELQQVASVCEHIFCAFFLVEFVLRLCFLGWRIFVPCVASPVSTGEQLQNFMDALLVWGTGVFMSWIVPLVGLSLLVEYRT
eukprot:symbB.v1.2.023738.t1/scaffold2147.1/size87931/2